MNCLTKSNWTTTLRRIACTTLLAATTLVPAFADGWGPGVRMTESVARLMDSARLLGDRTSFGYDGNISILSAFLRTDAEVKLTRHFNAGTRYLVLGGGDNQAGDLDIQVLDSDGRMVAEDRLTDAAPVVDFTPTRSGTYTLRVHLYSGKPSFCTVAILRDGGFTVPVNNVVTALHGLILRCNAVDRMTPTDVTFHDAPNSWAMVGGAFAPGEAQSITHMNLGTGKRVMLSSADSNAIDIDLHVLNEKGEVRAKDEDADPNPIVSVTVNNATDAGLKISNVRSNGRSLVLTAFLDVATARLD